MCTLGYRNGSNSMPHILSLVHKIKQQSLFPKVNSGQLAPDSLWSILGAQAVLLWVTSGRVGHREEGVIYLPEVRGDNQGPGRPGTGGTVSSWVTVAEGKGATRMSTAAKAEQLCAATCRKASGWRMRRVNFVGSITGRKTRLWLEGLRVAAEATGTAPNWWREEGGNGNGPQRRWLQSLAKL